MSADDPLAGLLACPRCDKTPLRRDERGYRCGACKTEFGNAGGIPWLFAEPDATLAEWRNRLHFSLQQLAHESKRLRLELDTDGLRDLTRTRLEAQLVATDEHRKILQRILSPVDVQSMQASYESHLALRTRLPSDQGLNTYYANVHRDWVWGDDENAASLQQIDGVMRAGGNPDPGDTLVLGAGAGRLAYDLHRRSDSGVTVALDFNPLLMLIARQVTGGQTLDLYEFPIAPSSLDNVAVLQTLSAPEPAGPDFHLVLADVLRPPFAAGSFDTIVTPWLIDIVSEDLPVFAARINRLLRPGGRWINFGSLAFDHPQRARRYSPDEVLEIVTESGFGKPEVAEATIPYLCSPLSRHGRRERVFTFCATKEMAVKPPERHKALPDWIVLGNVPVPLLPPFRTQAMTTQIYAFVMSMIDGKRSVADMASIMEQQKLMTRKEAEPAIRNFLTRMYDDSQRNAGF